jgi:hypothetical protein
MLDNSVWLFHDMHGDAIRRMLAAHASTIDGHDRADYDMLTETVTYLRDGVAIACYRAEVLATLDPETRLFRWGWADRPVNARGTIDAVYREGERNDLPQLASNQLRGVWEADAERLVALGAHLANAVGVLRRVAGGRHQWLALFAPPGASPSRTPPPLPPRARSARPPSVIGPAPVQTMPPAAPDGAPSMALASVIREPSRWLVRDVALAFLDDLRTKHAGFREAAFTIRIDLRQTKARFVAQLSFIDAAGHIQIMDPSLAVMDACAQMIRRDHADGNGRWQRLFVRLSSDALGGTTSDVAVS